jgi:hypothetical protein
MATHTLLDSVQGGQLFVSGGKEAVFPNHALELTVWNFKHRCGCRFDIFGSGES